VFYNCVPGIVATIKLPLRRTLLLSVYYSTSSCHPVPITIGIEG
jgi:hypothetical protein